MRNKGDHTNSKTKFTMDEYISQSIMIKYYNIVEEQRTIIQILKQNVPWMNIFLSQ